MFRVAFALVGLMLSGGFGLSSAQAHEDNAAACRTVRATIQGIDAPQSVKRVLQSQSVRFISDQAGAHWNLRTYRFGNGRFLLSVRQSSADIFAPRAEVVFSVTPNMVAVTLNRGQGRPPRALRELAQRLELELHRPLEQLNESFTRLERLGGPHAGTWGVTTVRKDGRGQQLERANHVLAHDGGLLATTEETIARHSLDTLRPSAGRAVLSARQTSHDSGLLTDSPRL